MTASCARRTWPVSHSATRMMGIVHGALRRDLLRTHHALTAEPYPQGRRRQALGQHVVWMMEFLHAHHTSEDEGLWPRRPGRRAAGTACRPAMCLSSPTPAMSATRRSTVPRSSAPRAGCRRWPRRSVAAVHRLRCRGRRRGPAGVQPGGVPQPAGETMAVGHPGRGPAPAGRLPDRAGDQPRPAAGTSGPGAGNDSRQAVGSSRSAARSHLYGSDRGQRNPGRLGAAVCRPAVVCRC